MNSDTPLNPWYERKRLVAGLLIVLFPIGLWGLWRSSVFSTRFKLGVSIPFILLFGAAVRTSVEEKQQNESEASEARHQPRDTVSLRERKESQSSRSGADDSAAKQMPSGLTLESLEQMEMFSDEWDRLHAQLVLQAQDAHPAGSPLGLQGGWDWAYEQTQALERWISGHPVSEVVTRLQLEKDSVCGDYQVVLMCIEDPKLSAISKTAIMYRLSSSDGKGGSGLRIPIAIAVSNTIVERWTSDEWQAIVDDKTGPMPMGESYSSTSTIAERSRADDEYANRVDEWSAAIAEAWEPVLQEAGYYTENRK